MTNTNYEVQVKVNGGEYRVFTFKNWIDAKNTFEFYGKDKGLFNLEEVLFIDYVEERLAVA